jgi:hypothetical protein
VSHWTNRTQPIEVGDTVAYSKDFLLSVGQFTGDAPHARGKVTGLLRVSLEVTLAQIDWDRPGLPTRVNIRNLINTKGITLGE